MSVGAEELGRWADRIVEACAGLETEEEIARSIDRAGEELNPEAFAALVEESLVRSAMLGATDSMIEREDDEEEPMPQLASWRTLMQKRATKTLTGEPFQAAIEEFGARNIVPRETFDQLTDAAKKKAFTVAGLAAEELLADAHAELARQVANSKEKSYFDEGTGKWVYKGPILRDFQKFAKDRLEKAGWTPANPSHVETVFRTNVLSAYSSGRIIETTQPTVLALRPYWQITGVNDSRQRKSHKKAQGTILAADHPFWRKAYPPFGYNCFLPGTVVRGNFTGASRAVYSGKAIELTSAKGRRLSVTANHPVLTTSGFVRAGTMRNGDDLVCYVDETGVSLLGSGSERDKKHGPSSVEQVFSALAKATSTEFASPGADNFHGEAKFFNGEIEVVGSYRALHVDAESAAGDHHSEFGFESADSSGVTGGPALKLCRGAFATASGAPSRSALSLDGAPISFETPPFQALRFGLPTEFDAVLTEDATDGLTADSELLGKLINGRSGLVELDQVVDVREFDFCGHVYDLETENGWLFADGIASSNCRCRVTSRSKRWVDAHGGPTRVPEGLPDKGFASGIDASLVPRLAVPSEGQREPTAPKPPRPLDAPIGLPKTTKPQFAPKPVPFQPTTSLAPIEVQKPMPVQPVTPATTAREIMGAQLAGPGGSNPGGLFLGTDGKKRYVKLYSDPSQAAGEHLANKLYADLGLGRVKSQLFDSNGKLAYASEYIEGAKPIGVDGLTHELAKKALDGLVGDMVTANWDAAGLTLDNLVVTKAGQVLRIDNGGTFLMRAQAGRKPAELLNALPEWDGFFSSEINPSYAKLASVAGVNSPADMLPEIRKQLKALRDLRAKSGSWLSYIEKHAPGLAADDAAAIAQMLESRTAAIAEKIRETQAAIDAAEVAAKRAAKRAKTAKVAFRDIQEAEPIPAGVPVPGVENPSAAAPNELFKKTEEFRNKTVTRAAKVFTPEESQSINQFTQGSDDIRAAFKLDREAYEIRRQSDQFMRGYDEARADGERINVAIAKARASTEERPELVPKELFRGMRDLNKEQFDALISKSTLTWTEPTSTSWNPESAKFFYTNEGRDNYSIYLRIAPSKNPNAIAIEGISDARTEREILYGSGSKFRVTRVVRDAEFERGAIVYLEEI